MSTTSMLTSNQLAVKAYSERKDWLQTMQSTAFGLMMARGAVYTPPELHSNQSTKRGDELTFPYTANLSGAPVGEGGTLTGNVSALDVGYHKIKIGSSRKGIGVPGPDTIEQQRTFVDLSGQERNRELFRKYFAKLLDYSMFYQLAGVNPTSFVAAGTTYTSTTKAHVQGHNTIVAPTSERIIRPSVSITNDESITSTDKMSLDLIDYAIELNARSEQPIEPTSDGNFDLFLSPEQVVDLKHSAGSKIQWFNIQLAKLTGGKSNELEAAMGNGLPILGTYNNVNIRGASRVAFGAHSSTSTVITSVRRAVLVGSDALAYVSPYGGRLKGDKDVPLKYTTEMKDHEETVEFGARLLYGMKKMSPSNGQDIGCMVISTYAGAHA